MDFLFEDDDTTSRKNNMWIYWVDFEQEDGGAVSICLSAMQFFIEIETSIVRNRC